MKLTSLLFLSSPLAAYAFVPAASSRACTEVNAANDNRDFVEALRPFGTLVVAASLAFSPISASALDNHFDETNAITSSSFQVSEAIKVLDMVSLCNFLSTFFQKSLLHWIFALIDVRIFLIS